jgi:MFS family permease
MRDDRVLCDPFVYADVRPHAVTSPLDQAFSAQAISLACMIVLIPVFGALSDHIGRNPIMIGALILYFDLTYPLFSGCMPVRLSEI